MNLVITAAAISLLQSGAAANTQVDVAVDELVAQQNREAIVRIEANDALDVREPSRLINLGVAFAREGQIDKARALFEAVARSETRERLETANGEWIDSKRLAYRALAALDSGELGGKMRVASR